MNNTMLNTSMPMTLCPMPPINLLPMNNNNLIDIVALQQDLDSINSGYQLVPRSVFCDLIQKTTENNAHSSDSSSSSSTVDQLSQALQMQTEENKLLRAEMHKLEIENRSLSKAKETAKHQQSVLDELYLSSQRVKVFMDCIQKYGTHFEKLKKRQSNLIKCVGSEDNEMLKIRMEGFLEDDIAQLEASYNAIKECLDVICTETDGKEIELMTQQRQQIELLERRTCNQSQELVRYSKKNQKLQTDLTDREMKLRQSQNSLNHWKQRANQVWNVNANVNGQQYSEYTNGYC